MKYFYRLKMWYYTRYSPMNSAEKRQKRGRYLLLIMYALYVSLFILLLITKTNHASEILVRLLILLVFPVGGYLCLYKEEALYQCSFWNPHRPEHSPVPECMLAYYRICGVLFWIVGIIFLAAPLLN